MITNRIRRFVYFAAVMLALHRYAPESIGQSVTINFDDAADGTVVNNRYAGVTFSNPMGGNIFARNASGFAPSPPNVVSVVGSGGAAFDALMGAVDATFWTPQSTVSIDVKPVGPAADNLGQPLNRPFLEAYSGNQWLGTVRYAGLLPTGCCFAVGALETLTFTSTTANITRVRFSSQVTQSSIRTFGLFDNLKFAPLAFEVAPLKVFWSPSREDNFSTATEAGEAAAVGAGYRFIRTEGSVLKNMYPGTVPLNVYWSWARGDNFTTATAQGEKDALGAGYIFIRTEGYVFSSPQPGTVPLKSFWSWARGDNFTTATAQGEADALAAGYSFVR